MNFGTKIKIEYEQFLAQKFKLLSKIIIEFQMFLARKFKLFTKNQIKNSNFGQKIKIES